MKRFIPIVLLLFLVLGNGCTGTHHAHENGKNAHGLSSERLERLTQRMQAEIDAGHLSGVVMLAHRGGREAYASVQGFQDVEAERPMQRDTLFRIYSMSKPIAAVSILLLVEEGKLRLSDPVSQHIPELAGMKVMVDPNGSLDDVVDARREMIVRDLLTHTCGVPYTFSAPPAYAAEMEKVLPDLGESSGEAWDDLTPGRFLALVSSLPLVDHPGEKWRYSLGLDLAGIVVERVSGVRFGEYLRTNLFEPLAMHDTAFWVPEDKISRLAVTYSLDSNTRKTAPIAFPKIGRLDTPLAFERGGDGLVSTADDYLRFSRMILNRGELDGVRVLSRKSVELMTSNALPPSAFPDAALGRNFFLGRGFGLGVSVVDDPGLRGQLGSAGQNGWGGAAGTYYFVDFEENLAAVFMIQRMLSDDEELSLTDDFVTMIYQAIDD